MTRLDSDPILDSTRLSAAIDGLPGWPHGPVHVVGIVRIGAEHGLSGRVYRVTAETLDQKPVTFIVKRRDDIEGIERALAFHRATGDRLRGSVPACYGGEVAAGGGTGVLFLEDIAPAMQGDVLVDPGVEQARAAVRTIARVHAASWRTSVRDHPGSLPRWCAERWTRDRWSERLAGARARYPAILTDEHMHSLDRLPDELDGAIGELDGGPASWIHGDAHLDNILWRPDGSAVLIDWAGAAIGPPAVDVARFLIEGPPDVAEDEGRSREIVAAYEEELLRGGVPPAAAGTVERAIGLAMLPLTQSVIGWASAGSRATLASDGGHTSAGPSECVDLAVSLTDGTTGRAGTVHRHIWDTVPDWVRSSRRAAAHTTHMGPRSIGGGGRLVVAPQVWCRRLVLANVGRVEQRAAVHRVEPGPWPRLCGRPRRPSPGRGRDVGGSHAEAPQRVA